MTLWTNKTGLQGGLGGKRSPLLWMSEGSMILQLDPLDHHFDPEGQAPTLWTSTSWSTGSEGVNLLEWVGEGVRKRYFLTAKKTKTFGKKDRFPGGGGNRKR
jgi:hypothetical protein